MKEDRRQGVERRKMLPRLNTGRRSDEETQGNPPPPLVDIGGMAQRSLKIPTWRWYPAWWKKQR